MSVKRYEPNVYEVLGGQYECEMSEDDHGDYVLNSDYAALLARHNALVGAVKKYFKSERLEILKRDASAEVERLIANESAAECEGEK